MFGIVGSIPEARSFMAAKSQKALRMQLSGLGKAQPPIRLSWQTAPERRACFWRHYFTKDFR